MRVACLQFAPQVGDVEENLDKADAILDSADPKDLDLLVLPELAFSGYNFKSLEHIAPFLEEGDQGVSTLWARSMALKHDCTVVVGYPEKTGPVLERPGEYEYYNTAVVMNGDGEVVANYRKTHLYYTDETWAREGPSGFYRGHIEGLGQTVLGICMDINPYKFEAPWNKFEFAQHAVNTGARLVVLSMAWLTNDNPQVFNATPSKPDTDTLLYWVARLEPIIHKESDEEIIVVFANRCGAEDEATYAGTSAVLGIRSGEILIYGILGRGDDGLLVVDTDAEPYAKLVYQPSSADETLHEKAQREGEAGGKGEEEKRQGDPGESKEDFLNVEAEPASKDSHKNTQVNPSAKLPDSPLEQTTPLDMYAPSHLNHKPAFRAGQSNDRSDSPMIFESIASNPNPEHFRTTPVIPDDQYMLQRYLELESPSTPISTSDSKSLDGPSRYLTVSKFPNPSSSPKYPSPSSSLAKARKSHKSTPDHLNIPLDSLLLRDDDEESVRSDVSVWNNQPGRVPNIIAPITRPSN